MTTAHALARCGFGEELVNAFAVLPDNIFAEYLNQWRDALRSELRTNSRGYLPRKQAKLAASVSDAFPSLKVLHAYVQPVTTESEALSAGLSPPVPQIQWRHEHSLATLARFCEEKFEWGTIQIIPKRFRSLLWHGSVIRILRRAMLDLDRGEGASWKHVRSTEKPSTKDSNASAIPRTPTKNGKNTREAGCGTAIGTPSRMITKYFADITLYSPAKHRDASGDQDVASADTDEEHPLISNISASTTAHPQTDFLLEYRIELDPYQLVLLTQSGIEGVREEPADVSDAHSEDEEVNGPRNQKRKPKEVDAFSSHRIWVPACMLQPVEKELVDVYEAKQEAKQAKKTRKAPPKGKRTATGPDPATETASISTAKSRPKTRKGASAPAGARAKKATRAPPNDDNAENFDLDAVSDASDSDASGGLTTSKPTTTTAPRKATACGRKAQREIATGSETDTDAGGEQAPLDARPRQKSIEPLSLSSKPTQAKAAKLPRGEPSGQRGLLPAQDKSKTSHSSVLKALDSADWDDLFPPALKAPMPSSLSPSSLTQTHHSQRRSKAGSAAAPSSPSKRRRRQVFCDTGEDSERAESTKSSVPKSPRKSKSQVSPSHRKEKTTISRTNRQENLVLPYLSSSDSEDDDVSGADVCGGARRVVSPTPRKGAAKDPFRTLWDKVGLASRQVSKRPEEIIDVSSEDGVEPVAPNQRMSSQANSDDLAGTITQKGGSISTVSKSTQPRLPFRPVKTTAAKKPATKPHLTKDGSPTHAQRNTLAVDVIDLTTP